MITNVPPQDIFADPNPDPPGLDGSDVQGWEYPEFIEQGVTERVSSDEAYWRQGDNLRLAVKALGLVVAPGRRSSTSRKVSNYLESRILGLDNALVEVFPGFDQPMAIRNLLVTPDEAIADWYSVIVPIDQVPAGWGSASSLAPGYRVVKHERVKHLESDKILYLPSDWLEEPQTLTALGEEIGLDRRKSSRLYKNAAFYPRQYRRPADITFNTYDIARRYSDDDLENALDLLNRSATLQLAGKSFEDYCKGVFFDGLWPQDQPFPAWAARYLPARHQSGDGVRVYVKIVKEDELQ